MASERSKRRDLLACIFIKKLKYLKYLNQFFTSVSFFKVFKESSTSTSVEKDQQKVSESILNFFSGFESFSLPPPSSDDEVMQNISHAKDKLNPKFLDGVKRFKFLLKSKLAPKRSINQGEFVTGEGKESLMQVYYY